MASTTAWLKKMTSTERTESGHFRTISSLCAGLFISLSLLSMTTAADTIEFAYFNVSLQESHYYLDAQVAVELNSTVEAGLKSGVPLFFDAKGKVLKVRPILWDKTVGTFERRFRLVYYELTRHYRVSAVGEDITRNFRSLFDALEYLGSVQRLPIVAQSSLGKTQKYRGEFSFSLDTGALPLQLTTQTLVSSAWRLKSENYQWPIN